MAPSDKFYGISTSRFILFQAFTDETVPIIVQLNNNNLDA